MYERNRMNCGAKSKLLVAIEFIDFACEKIIDEGWYLTHYLTLTNTSKKLERQQMVYTETLYNYIDLDLLSVRNIELLMKTKLNTKKKRVR